MKIDPAGAAILLLFVGAVLIVFGVYLLAGRGWACIAGAVPCLLAGLVLVRGVMRSESPRG